MLAAHLLFLQMFLLKSDYVLQQTCINECVRPGLIQLLPGASTWFPMLK